MKATELKLNQTFTIENTVLMPMVRKYKVVEVKPNFVIGKLESAYIRTLGQPIELNIENLSKLLILEPNEIVNL